MLEDDGYSPHRVMGLVMHLLRELREHRIQIEDIDSVSDELIVQGYTESEISAAMNWIFTRLETVEPADMIFRSDTNQNSFRVFHPAEIAMLTPEAQGQLVEMLNLGLITLEDFEQIMNRIMSFNGQLSGEELRILIHQFIADQGSRAISNGILNFTNNNSSVN